MSGNEGLNFNGEEQVPLTGDAFIAAAQQRVRDDDERIRILSERFDSACARFGTQRDTYLFNAPQQHRNPFAGRGRFLGDPPRDQQTPPPAAVPLPPAQPQETRGFFGFFTRGQQPPAGNGPQLG